MNQTKALDKLDDLEQRIVQCRICRDNPVGKQLPHEPRPVAVLSGTAKVRIVGQAPGRRVYVSGRPFTDPSGDRLRDWMGLDEETFYDSGRIAITPMGFCFPGHDEKGGDLPPRRECAATWQKQITDAMPQVELVLLIGLYAQKFYLGGLAERTLTETVGNWRTIAGKSNKPVYFPLPHPSWRNNVWIKKNPWFASELIPNLQKLIQVHMN